MSNDIWDEEKEGDDILVVSLTLQEKPVKIDGQTWKVKEMMGTQRDKWMKSMSLRMRTDAAGKVSGLKEYDGLHTSLICLCLHDPDGNLVKSDVADKWPASAQTKLFDLCQKVNGLGEAAEEVKKD